MIHYLGDTAENMVEALRRLSADIDRIRSGSSPTAEELAGAPLLDAWSPALNTQVVLAGSVSGHPRLPGGGRLISTSQLFVIDAERGWARTWSRFFRLGATAGERLAGGSA